ncbi:MAG: hypothetical protein RL026_1466 [Pseudomonadota bacterium]
MPLQPAHHRETHRLDAIGWLRAGVLGANDGLISTSSLMIGMAAAAAGGTVVLLAGLAGLVGGALSMGAGEYVSVSAQSDAETANLAKERWELANIPEAEHRELAAIYRQRGLSPALADQVATELTAHDALGAHARDELGITDFSKAQPLLAAAASAASFAAGALPPLLLALWLPAAQLAPWLAGMTVALLAGLGALAALLGGAPPARAALRVAFWGALALGITHLAGRWFGALV